MLFEFENIIFTISDIRLVGDTYKIFWEIPYNSGFLLNHKLDILSNIILYMVEYSLKKCTN